MNKENTSFRLSTLTTPFLTKSCHRWNALNNVKKLVALSSTFPFYWRPNEAPSEEAFPSDWKAQIRAPPFVRFHPFVQTQNLWVFKQVLAPSPQKKDGYRNEGRLRPARSWVKSDKKGFPFPGHFVLKKSLKRDPAWDVLCLINIHGDHFSLSLLATASFLPSFFAIKCWRMIHHLRSLDWTRGKLLSTLALFPCVFFWANFFGPGFPVSVG